MDAEGLKAATEVGVIGLTKSLDKVIANGLTPATFDTPGRPHHVLTGCDLEDQAIKKGR